MYLLVKRENTQEMTQMELIDKDINIIWMEFPLLAMVE